MYMKVYILLKNKSVYYSRNFARFMFLIIIIIFMILLQLLQLVKNFSQASKLFCSFKVLIFFFFLPL